MNMDIEICISKALLVYLSMSVYIYIYMYIYIYIYIYKSECMFHIYIYILRQCVSACTCHVDIYLAPLGCVPVGVHWNIDYVNPIN